MDVLNLFEHKSRMLTRRIFKRVQFLLMRRAFPIGYKERAAFRHGSRIFLNSVPKAGTNLLKRVLLLTPHTVPRWAYQLDDNCPDRFQQLRSARGGQVVTAHEPWSEELSKFLVEENFHLFFMIRDPRDMVVSNAFYIAYKDKSHRLHNYFRNLESDTARIKASIEGVDADLLHDGKRSKSWREHIETYMPWIGTKECLTIRFEDLIGHDGGGNKKSQLQTVASVIRHLGLDLPQYRIEEIARKTFSTGSKTFRKGQIGDWRNYFDEDLKHCFQETLGETLIKMGYENGYDW